MKTLRFPKFGSIDKVSDYAEGKAIHVDIDGRSQPVRLTIPYIFSICRIVGIKPLATRYHRTKRGWHITLFMGDESPSLTRNDIVTMQSILGSDPMREALNLMRVRAMRGKRVPKFWKQRWNILYDYKVE